MIAADLTIDCCYIEIEDPNDFDVFRDLLEKGVATISVETSRRLLSIARQLGNSELIEKFASLHEFPDELTPMNILAELKFCEQFDFFSERVLQYAAENFVEIQDKVSLQFEIRTLDLIFAKPMILDSEDSFFDFIRNEIQNRGQGCLELLSHVDLRCLSAQKMTEFLELVDLETISPGIWERICERLRSPDSHPCHRSPTHEYAPSIQPGSDFFDGVFARLKRETGQNCALNGTIVATASNTHCGVLTILFDKSDWGQASYWHHDTVKDGWFQVDFKDRRLVMTHYAIHNSVYWVREHDFLKTWTVEGSNDGTKWSVIDSRTNDGTLHGKDKVQALFKCNGDTNHAFRFIRLYQRGVSHDPSNYHFLISQFEVFGLLYPPVCKTSGSV